MRAASSFHVLAWHKMTEKCKLKSNLKIKNERERFAKRSRKFFETFILANVNFAGKLKILAMSFENLVVWLKYFPPKKTCQVSIKTI